MLLLTTAIRTLSKSIFSDILLETNNRNLHFMRTIFDVEPRVRFIEQECTVVPNSDMCFAINAQGGRTS